MLDQLEKLNAEPGPLHGRLDLSRVGMAGHSFGAHTTLIIAGQQMVGPLGKAMSLADPRVLAAIPMSAPVPVNRAQWKQTYETVKIPCLHMTGTEDNSPIGQTTAQQRRVPFDQISGATGYLIIFQGGDHMIFSGRGRLRAKPTDARFQALIVEATTKFWDAYLKHDATAEAWLNNDGLKKALGKDATLETKIGTSRPFPLASDDSR